MTDRKARNILLNTYWSAAGWKRDPAIDPQDFAYAKEKGVMFDPISLTHEECVERIVELAGVISKEQVARAFLSSLSTHTPEWRSAVASRHIAGFLSPHKFTPCTTGQVLEDGKFCHTVYSCAVCRDLNPRIRNTYEDYNDEDLSVLNFERMKWGGVRVGQLVYTYFDLQQFTKEQVSEPTEPDVKILSRILEAADTCNAKDSPGALRDRMKNIPDFKTNKNESAVILEILGCIGVLKPGSYDRASRGEWVYVGCWRGEDGCNAEAVYDHFGQYL